MKIRFTSPVCAVLPILLAFAPAGGLSQQVAISRIDQMPDSPAPYLMRNWKSVAASFDSIAFDDSRPGLYLPLIRRYSNTVNYPGQESFRIQSYVGSPGSGGEAVTCLPALVGAKLVGIDKSNQAGTNWVVMAQEWFNSRNGENVYLNSPSSVTGDDWWYETMPNVFAFQIASLYPSTGDFRARIPVVAGRWRAAVTAMGGNTAPWSLANVNHRAFNLLTMKPYNYANYPEPEAAGAIAWILYMAYVATGNQDFRAGAELSLESLLVYPTNPSYELQLPYGTYIAARMNAEIGTSYDIAKMMNWCFPDGNGTIRQWGAIVGNWGGFDCSGLIGESSTANDYAFFMNGAEQAGALVPLVRYDDRYARAIGKWVLNVANASRLFYTNYLPDDHQDSQVWAHQYDPSSSIAHESMHQFSPANGTISPFATGDAIGNGSPTNLGLYGAAHVGILGGVIDTTNVQKILRLDLLRTDYFHATAYPTYLYFNPRAADTAVSLTLEAGAHDLYNTVTKTFLAQGATGTVQITIPANSAVVVVIAPAGGTMTTDLDRTLINGIVVDYRNGYSANHPPRIKSLSPDSSRVLVRTAVNFYCTAADRENDALAYAWSSSRGTIAGSGPVVSWTAPDTAGTFTVSCAVDDGRGGKVSATDTVQVVAKLSHPPSIRKILAVPRKVDLGASAALSCLVSNPDTSLLTYAWSASAGSMSGTGPAVTWHAPSVAGNDYVRCTVDDGKGGLATDSLALEVRDLSVVQTGDLIAFYPFTGNPLDGSGHGHNGTVNGAVVPAADRFGHAASAYAFDGTTSSIVVPNDSGLNFQNAITVNVWVKPSAFYDVREQYILSHGNWQNRWKLSVTPGTNKLRWTVKNSTGPRDLDSASPLVLDSLMNITALYNGTDMEIYVNGTLDSFTPFSGLISTTTYALTIAEDLPSDNQYDFSGVLDDIRLYNYGLTLGQISALYDIATGAGPVATAPLPSVFRLFQNYPNPFNPSTTISFAVPGSAASRSLSLRVYDLLGREVATLANGTYHGGLYSVVWDGRSLSSGVYLCRLESEGASFVQKMVLMK
jgi:hypothetical protein